MVESTDLHRLIPCSLDTGMCYASTDCAGLSADDLCNYCETSVVEFEMVTHTDDLSMYVTESTNAKQRQKIPDHMTLITTLSDCTSEGRKFTDDVNDFSLEIPEGAIPEGERLTIDVGVALFGPFQFPEGLRPVSPVFWVCVRDNPNFQFSKSVTVTIPHFLHLENNEDIQSLGLTFLKADHNMDPKRVMNFLPTDGKIKFQPSSKFGVLQTNHFCSLCIACKDKPEILTKTDFCKISVIPACAIADGTKQLAFFFITFYNLRTCLRKVDEVIAKMKLENYQKREVKFNFKETTQPSLEMSITQPKHGNIGVEGQTKVKSSQILCA